MRLWKHFLEPFDFALALSFALFPLHRTDFAFPPKSLTYRCLYLSSIIASAWVGFIATEYRPNLGCLTVLLFGSVDVVLWIIHKHSREGGSPTRARADKVLCVAFLRLLGGNSKLFKRVLSGGNVCQFVGADNLQHPQVSVCLLIPGNDSLGR